MREVFRKFRRINFSVLLSLASGVIKVDGEVALFSIIGAKRYWYYVPLVQSGGYKSLRDEVKQLRYIGPH